VDSDGAVRAIYEGDTPRRQAEWEAENERRRQAAGMEQADNSRKIQEYNAQTAAEAAAARQGMVGEAARYRQQRAKEAEDRQRAQQAYLDKMAALKEAEINKPPAPPKEVTNLDPLYVLNNPDKFRPEVVESARKEREARIGQMNRSNVDKPSSGGRGSEPTQQEQLDELTKKVIDDAARGGASEWEHAIKNVKEHYRHDPRFTPIRRRKIVEELQAQQMAMFPFPAQPKAQQQTQQQQASPKSVGPVGGAPRSSDPLGIR
jgi:hypothetical protein